MLFLLVEGAEKLYGCSALYGESVFLPAFTSTVQTKAVMAFWRFEACRVDVMWLA